MEALASWLRPPVEMTFNLVPPSLPPPSLPPPSLPRARTHNILISLILSLLLLLHRRRRLIFMLDRKSSPAARPSTRHRGTTVVVTCNSALGFLTSSKLSHSQSFPLIESSGLVKTAARQMTFSFHDVWLAVVVSARFLGGRRRQEDESPPARARARRPLPRARPWFSEELPPADNEFISAFLSFAAERAERGGGRRKEMLEINAQVPPSFLPPFPPSHILQVIT